MAKTVHFVDHFWGERNEGFSVLYANLKCGLAASKELGEFLGQSARLQEEEAKAHLKILKQFTISNGQCGSFSPVLLSLKMATEQLATVHHTWMLKLQEVVRGVHKYGDDLQKGVKRIKEEETPTMEAVKSLQEVSTQVHRARELFKQRCQELEKCRKDSNNNSSVEKAENKMRKALDEYRALVERHSHCRDDFEHKMTDTASRLEENERTYLDQMRTFVQNYCQAANDNSKQWLKVQQDLEERLSELSTDNLIEQFTLAKSTGVERPGPVSLDDERASLSTINSDRGSLTGSVKEGLNHKGSSSSMAPSASGSVGVADSSAPPPLPPPRPPPLLSVDQSSTPKPTSEESPTETSTIAPHFNENNTTTINSTARSGWPGFLRRRNRKKKSAKASDEETESHSEMDDSLAAPRSKTPTTPEAGSNLLIDTSSIKSSTAEPLSSSSQQPSSNRLVAVESEKDPWDDFNRPQTKFDSSSDDSGDEDDAKRKLKVEIKPVSNSGEGESSASVDELRSAIVGLDLGVPISKSRPQSALNERINSAAVNKRESSVLSSVMEGNSIRRAQSQSQLSVLRSAGNENKSNDFMALALHPVDFDKGVKTTVNKEAGSEMPAYENSPELMNQPDDSTNAANYHNVSINSNTTNQEVAAIMGDFTTDQPWLPPKQNTSKRASSIQRELISSSLVALPRPPSRHSAVHTRPQQRASPLTVLEPKLTLAKDSSNEGDQNSRKGSEDNKAKSTQNRKAITTPSFGSSRGPSPLALGLNDCIPLAVAFQEICHACFKDADESQCQVRLLGDMMISFPAGIVQVFASNPNPSPLIFRVVKAAVLEAVVPNKQLISQSMPLSTNESLVFEFNMAALRDLLQKQAEQNPSASYFNIDILKYQIRRRNGALSCPLHLVAYWKCSPEHTDLRLDYKYNGRAMAKAMPLLNLSISVPVTGGVQSLQAKPNATWMGESGRALWQVSSLSADTEGGVGSLRGRFQLSNGPGSQGTIAAQFNCEGTSLSGIDFELMGTGYRLSLVKKRFVSGKYICDGDASGRGGRYATVPSSSPVHL